MDWWETEPGHFGHAVKWCSSLSLLRICMRWACCETIYIYRIAQSFGSGTHPAVSNNLDDANADMSND